MIDRGMVMETLGCVPKIYPRVLEERFPHVLNKIVELWDSPLCQPYFTDLLQQSGRGGGRVNRDGFPDDAWQEIFQLNEFCWIYHSGFDDKHC